MGSRLIHHKNEIKNVSPVVLQKNRSAEEQVINLIGWTLGIPASEVFPYLHLKDDLHLDSLDLQLLIVKLEHHFHAFLTPDEVESIETVRDVIRQIRLHTDLR